MSSTSSRTAGSNRRRCSSRSSDWSRFSVTSSSTSRSRVRVTRKAWCSSISRPAKSSVRCAAITSSSGTKRCGETREEPGQQRRHLHPGEHGGAGARVGDHHRQAERQARDVRERVGRVDDQRREHRVDPLAEQPLQIRPARPRPAPSSAAISMPCCGQRRAGPSGIALGVAEASSRARPRVRASTSSGGRPVMLSTGRPVAIRRIRPGHPDHEELIQVAGEDRQEPDPFQQREGLVLGELQHPLVEPQPAFLAVEVAAGRKIGPLLVAALGRPGQAAPRTRPPGLSCLPGFPPAAAPPGRRGPPADPAAPRPIPAGPVSALPGPAARGAHHPAESRPAYCPCGHCPQCA